MQLPTKCRCNDLQKLFATLYKKWLQKTENEGASFVELPKPAIVQTDTPASAPAVAAILHGPGDITIEILNGASSELIRNVIGALAYAQ